MRHVAILLLSLGLGAASAVQQTETPLPEPGDSVSKHNEEIGHISNNASEQKESVDSLGTGLNDIIQDNIGGVSLTIEENVINPAELGPKLDLGEVLAQKIDLPTVYITEIPESPVEENDFYGTALTDYQDEIMDVAASWAPPPFFRTHRQKARRRYSVPRHFIPNPYRRFHYYPYHAFYRPRPYFY